MVDALEVEDARAVSPRSADTVNRALDTVAAMLQGGGEGCVRLVEISKRSGVSIGSLYHHFGSRSGLIAAARERQFARDRTYPGQIRAEAYIEATTPEEFVSVFEQSLRTSETPVAAEGRMHRFEMLGAAAARPTELPGVVELESDFLSRGEAIGRALHDRGWLKEGVEPRAVAIFLHTLSMARVVRDLDGLVSEEAWRALVRQAVRGILRSDGHPD